MVVINNGFHEMHDDVGILHCYLLINDGDWHGSSPASGDNGTTNNEPIIPIPIPIPVLIPTILSKFATTGFSAATPQLSRHTLLYATTTLGFNFFNLRTLNT
ncbi:uncharacterized protein DS421_3g92730 [Arachis hypogaea]|nr:uncharacterized protein DS421_3g92730 [Arachis hypogaea]